MTQEEIQKRFQEEQNELIGDMLGIMNKYFIKRLKAEQQIQELLKEDKTPKK